MKARTKYQQQVAAANRRMSESIAKRSLSIAERKGGRPQVSERLLPITEKQAAWAFKTQVSHYAFRTKSGATTCMDCGRTFHTDGKSQHCRCPECGARLDVKDTLCRKAVDKVYWSVLDVADGLQVQRVFLLTATYRKGKAASTHNREILRYWLNGKGKTEVTAQQRTLGHYMDTFVAYSDLELRSDNHVYRCIADCNVYPHYKATPTLRRNGLKGRFPDITPLRLMEALLTDSRIETLMKAGRKADMAYFLRYPMRLDICWDAYKIVLRKGYKIDDIGRWADYVSDLVTLGKDIHNAKYVCPLNLKAESDKAKSRLQVLAERRKRKEQQEAARRNEKRFRKMKARFFGLAFTDGKLCVAVLDSVDAYYQEGNAMHHCVGQSEYYLKPNTLVFSARIDSERIETVELSLDTFKVIQSRGHCNQNTPYHEAIINLVQRNAALVRERMAA